MADDFVGAKIALFTVSGAILTYLRDDKPGLPFANLWDLPGGGREGGESAPSCALRELAEEFGLSLPPERLIWRRAFPAMLWPDRLGWFFAGHLTPADVARIRFGDEGQAWQIMDWHDFCQRGDVIPAMRERAVIARAGLGI